MAHIIDVRYAGRELVIIGDRLVLPASQDQGIDPLLDQPPLGSLRRNQETNELQFFTTTTFGDVAAWQTVGTRQQNDARYLRLIGGTLEGPVVVNADVTINGVLRAATIDAVSLAALYAADLAERYEADQPYEPGTVLIVGGDKEVTVTRTPCDTRLAGVVSTKPAYGMNLAAGSDETHPLIALKGRVPCKVVGSIRKGDLLTTSQFAGHAMKAPIDCHSEAIIGKALADFDGAVGFVEVMV